MILPPEPFNAAAIVTRLAKCRAGWFSIDGKGEIYLRRAPLRLVDNRVVKSLDVANVEVVPEHRRQRVLTGAMREIERAAELLGADCVFVENIHNPIALAAVVKCGYTPLVAGYETHAYKCITCITFIKENESD